MYSTSFDVLNLVLSVCALALTFFLCWAIYYFIVSVQRINKITRIIEGGVVKIDGLMNIAKDKLKNSQTYFMILGEIAKRAMDFVQEKQFEKQEKRANGKKK